MDIKELQARVDFTLDFSPDFDVSDERHKEFRHIALHIAKAAGKVCDAAQQMDHGAETSEIIRRLPDYLADLVICAVWAGKLAVTFEIDMDAAVQRRLVEKFGEEGS